MNPLTYSTEHSSGGKFLVEAEKKCQKRRKKSSSFSHAPCHMSVLCRDISHPLTYVSHPSAFPTMKSKLLKYSKHSMICSLLLVMCDSLDFTLQFSSCLMPLASVNKKIKLFSLPPLSLALVSLFFLLLCLLHSSQ